MDSREKILINTNFDSMYSLKVVIPECPWTKNKKGYRRRKATMNLFSSAFRTSFCVLESAVFFVRTFTGCNGCGVSLLVATFSFFFFFGAMYHSLWAAGLEQNKSINDNESYVPKALNPPLNPPRCSSQTPSRKASIGSGKLKLHRS